ncbi:MAG: HDIG domain-containing protein [Phycisphaerae bacterium]|nr:HDIG domain-containing protein [Phycisphaerae bacterium]
MWPFGKTSPQRRRDIRKNIPPPAPSVWRRFRDAGGPGGVALVVAFYLAAVALDLWPLERVGYRAGQYLPEDVHARVRFEVPAPQAEPIDLSPRGPGPARFTLDRRVLEALREELTGLLAAAAPPDASATRPASPETRPATRAAETAATRPARTLAGVLGAEGLERYNAGVKALLADHLPGLLIVRPERITDERVTAAPEIRLGRQEGADLTVADTEALLPAGEGDALRAALREAAAHANLPEAAVEPVVRRLSAAFVEQARPLYRYDAEASALPIGPRYVPPKRGPEVYHRGDRIARRSRRMLEDGEHVVPLSRSALRRLRLEQQAYVAMQRRVHPWGAWVRPAGRAAIVLAITLTLCVYLAWYAPSIVHDVKRGLAVAGVLVAMLALSKLMDVGLGWNPHAVVLPVMMGAMALAIAHDQRLALAGGGALAILLTLQLRGGIALAILLATASTVAVFQTREIRSRSKLVEVAGITAAAAFAVVAAEGFINYVPWRFMLIDALWVGGFALLAGFLIQGLLPLIERLFGVATSMTLLELCDASKPLMRHLAMRAPGTYNHSLQLGAMCEAAAEAIDARGLLARAGAYYHDIGKSNKPHYFIENQAGSPSRHAKLSPAMSQLIITGHVKDGLEMAREYGLPSALHEFIATHHGTTLVQYFYHAAAEKSRREGADRAPDEMEFRYPGPKPRSKEAGILMLADASESSVRAMERPTPGRIENQVHAMVARRLTDGQLDDCALTLREVHVIEASLARSLCGIYHARLAYPTPTGQKASAAEGNQAGGEPSPRGASAGRPAEARAAAKDSGTSGPEDNEQVAES